MDRLQLYRKPHRQRGGLGGEEEGAGLGEMLGLTGEEEGDV